MNDSKHTAKSTKKWLTDHNVKLLEWSSQSPNLNPIENLWRYLKIQIRSRATNVKHLKKVCEEEWNKIPKGTCRALIINYRKILIAVQLSPGYATKYKIKIVLLSVLYEYFFHPQILKIVYNIFLVRLSWFFFAYKHYACVHNCCINMFLYSLLEMF